jgi:excisionase family DNA binding protein
MVRLGSYLLERFTWSGGGCGGDILTDTSVTKVKRDVSLCGGRWKGKNMYRFTTVSRLARQLDISSDTILRLIHSGRLSAVRVGNRFLISESEVSRIVSGGLGHGNRVSVSARSSELLTSEV